MASAFLVCRPSRTSYLKLRCGRLAHCWPRPNGYQRKLAQNLNPRMRQTRPYQILKAKYQTASSGLIAMGSATLGPGALAIHKYSSDHGSNAPSGSPSRETENDWASICTYRCSRKHGTAYVVRKDR